MLLQEGLSIEEKLKILSDAAKYDVACTSSGSKRRGEKGMLGNTTVSGICHSFSADGRCISLLKILFTNECIFDCKYCVNRYSNDVVRTSFTPDEVCKLTMEFYKRNYIEGLFLSSGILKSPTYTMELIYEAIYKLRVIHGFNGYIHVKAIPGASTEIIEKLGYLADRMSVNLELPTSDSMKRLTPQKTRNTILKPMKFIQNQIKDNKNELIIYNKSPKFVPAGQSTQMIIGATGENDYQIMAVSEALYKNYDLKRVFYSAYVPSVEDSLLPVLKDGPPLLREHRLYQADWLLRFYGFQANELLSEERPNFNVLLDPKCDWALRHLELFPVEINHANYYMLLRVPGIGVKSAKRIIKARRHGMLDFEHIKKMGVVLKRAQYFITCKGKMFNKVRIEENFITNQLIGVEHKNNWEIEHSNSYRQLTLFDDMNVSIPPTIEDKIIALHGQL